MSWRLARSLEQLKAEVLERWPGTTIWSIGDSSHRARASDHNPNPQGVVCAIDIVGLPQATEVYDHLLSRRDYRTKYVIHQRRIFNQYVSPWRERNYSGSNPHNNHVHVSVGRGPSGRSTGPYDEPGSWGIAEATSPDSSKEGTSNMTYGQVHAGDRERFIPVTRPGEVVLFTDHGDSVVRLAIGVAGGFKVWDTLTIPHGRHVREEIWDGAQGVSIRWLRGQPCGVGVLQ